MCFVDAINSHCSGIVLKWSRPDRNFYAQTHPNRLQSPGYNLTWWGYLWVDWAKGSWCRRFLLTGAVYIATMGKSSQTQLSCIRLFRAPSILRTVQFHISLNMDRPDLRLWHHGYQQTWEKMRLAHLKRVRGTEYTLFPPWVLFNWSDLVRHSPRVFEYCQTLKWCYWSNFDQRKERIVWSSAVPACIFATQLSSKFSGESLCNS